MAVETAAYSEQTDIQRPWLPAPAGRLMGRGHPAGDFLEAYHWRVLEAEPGGLQFLLRRGGSFHETSSILAFQRAGCHLGGRSPLHFRPMLKGRVCLFAEIQDQSAAHLFITPLKS